MISLRLACRFVLVTVAALGLFSTTIAVNAAKGDKQGAYVLTEVELQSELMAYADRFASISAQAIDDFLRGGPTPEARFVVLGDAVYSASAAYTIAADANPEAALLDLVVLATLQRLVFEQYWRPRLGRSVDTVTKAFGKLERDAWQIAAKILTKPQQQELRDLIKAFRRDNPEVSTVSHIRFANLPAIRKQSTLRRDKKTGGLFKSVRRATEQVEQTRMLAERGMYLGTRLPLLTGYFVDSWLTQWTLNPALKQVLADVHGFAVVSDRLATVAEQLPKQIAQERNTTIKQIAKERDRTMQELESFRDTTLEKVVTRVAQVRETTIDHAMNRIAEERKQTIQQFLAEEKRVKGVLSELRQTLAEGNNLMVSVNTLTDKLDLGAPSEPAEPFDIKDYRDTMVALAGAADGLNALVGSTNELVKAPGLDKFLSRLTEVLDEVGKESENVVDRAFIDAALLLLLGLVGYVIARLAYQWIAIRVFATTHE
jgi:hypothetical protein